MSTSLAVEWYPDVYFSHGYGDADQVAAGGSWVLVEAHDGAWQMPLLLRQVDGVTDAASPYGYSGIYTDGLSAHQAEQAWESAASVLREMDVVSVFLRRSPLVPQAPPPPGSLPVVTDHLTRGVAVTDPDSMWSGLDSSCRNKVRKATKAGLVATIRQPVAGDLLSGSAFRHLYESTMARRDAKDLYFFTDDYYLRLLKGVGGDLWLGEVTTPDGEAVAASLFLRHRSLLHYHLSGAAPGAAGAINLLLWAACERAAEEEIELFHLGGGVRNGDSLYKFKKSFGGRDLTYSAVGVVLDPANYEAAVVRRAEQLGLPVPKLQQARMFPAYRADAF